jgi:hypothetical protein
MLPTTTLFDEGACRGRYTRQAPSGAAGRQTCYRLGQPTQEWGGSHDSESTLPGGRTLAGVFGRLGMVP